MNLLFVAAKVTRRILLNPDHFPPPVGVISGGQELSELASAIPKLRLLRTVQKPFQPDELLAVVAEALADLST